MMLETRPLRLLARVPLVYLLVCLIMWYDQRNIIFLPDTHIREPSAYGLADFTTVPLDSSDGIRLQAWYHPAYGEDYPTIVYFHGNGGNLGDRSHYFRVLAEHGFGLLALDYRGYGKSAGKPSEQGLYRDARATMQYAIKTLALPESHIILYGESMGTAVAIQMATEYPYHALVLQSPFSSMVALAKIDYPWLPVDFLLEERFDSISKMGHVHGPLLFMHGERDDIVPVSENKTLFAHAPDPKDAVFFPDRGHANFDARALTQAMLDFAHKYQLVPSIPLRK